MPKINISPDRSKPPGDETLRVVWDTIASDILRYCAIYAVYEGSQFLSQIKSLTNRPIHMSYAANIADDYSKLVLVNLLLNLPSSAREIGKDGGVRSGETRQEKA